MSLYVDESTFGTHALHGGKDGRRVRRASDAIITVRLYITEVIGSASSIETTPRQYQCTAEF